MTFEGFVQNFPRFAVLREALEIGRVGRLSGDEALHDRFDPRRERGVAPAAPRNGPPHEPDDEGARHRDEHPDCDEDRLHRACSMEMSNDRNSGLHRNRVGAGCLLAYGRQA